VLTIRDAGIGRSVEAVSGDISSIVTWVAVTNCVRAAIAESSCRSFDGEVFHRRFNRFGFMPHFPLYQANSIDCGRGILGERHNGSVEVRLKIIISKGLHKVGLFKENQI